MRSDRYHHAHHVNHHTHHCAVGLQIMKIAGLFILIFALSACGTLKPVTTAPTGGSVSLLTRITAGLFTRAVMDDFIWDASVVSSVPIEQELLNIAGNPDLAAAFAIATATHLIEPSGSRVLYATLVGETKPRIFLCQKSLAQDCELPINAGVRIYAAPVSIENYGVLVIHRISVKTGK